VACIPRRFHALPCFFILRFAAFLRPAPRRRRAMLHLTARVYFEPPRCKDAAVSGAAMRSAFSCRQRAPSSISCCLLSADVLYFRLSLLCPTATRRRCLPPCCSILHCRPPARAQAADGGAAATRRCLSLMLHTVASSSAASVAAARSMRRMRGALRARKGTHCKGRIRPARARPFHFAQSSLSYLRALPPAWLVIEGLSFRGLQH